jgi:hypothetical protein
MKRINRIERREKIPHNFPISCSQLHDTSSIRYGQVGGAPAKIKRMEI